MKKTVFLIILLAAGLFYFAGAVASEAGEGAQQNDAMSGEEIVAMCEDKFSSDENSNEEERNNLIDKCINDMVNGSKPAAEES